MEGLNSPAPGMIRLQTPSAMGSISWVTLFVSDEPAYSPAEGRMLPNNVQIRATLRLDTLKVLKMSPLLYFPFSPYNKTPAMVAVIKAAKVPPIMALKLSVAKSARRFGTRAPMPPI